MMKYYLSPILYFLFIFSSGAQPSKLETVVQKGHNAAVKAIAVSHDGNFVVTASRDKSAKLWDLATGRELRSFMGHEFTINGVEFSQNGKYLATSSADNTAKVWEVLSGKEIFSIQEQQKYMTDVAFSPDGKYFICAGYNDSAYVWDFRAKKIIKSIEVNADQGSGYGVNLAFSPDGNLLAIGEDNKTAKIYDTHTWGLVHILKPAEGWCGGCGTMVSFSHDNKFLMKLSHHAKPEKYDLKDGKLLRSYGEEYNEISGVAFSPDGKRILASGKNVVTIWDSETGEKIIDISISDKTSINEAVYSIDGSMVLLAQDDNIATAYDASTGKLEMTFSGIQNMEDRGGIDYDASNYRESYIAKYIRLKNNILLSADGKMYLKGKSGTQAAMWDIASGEPQQQFIGNEKAVLCFDQSIDGKAIVTGDGAGKAALWDTKSGKKLKSFDGHREPIFEVCFNAAASSMATSSWDATVIVWNTTTGAKEQYIDLNNSSAYSMSFTPDGLYLVTGTLLKTLDLWEPDSKTIVRSFVGHTDIVSSIVFSPDKNKQMLTASWDGTARIWDISTGMMVKKFKGVKGGLHTAIYTPDGKQVITGGDDRIIRVWDANTSKILKVFEGHQSEVTCIRITPDGKMLVSASVDGVIKFWDLDKGKEFYEHIHVGDHDWMARTTDGYFNATDGARSAIHFVKGMQSFGVDQFFEKFYRPELLPQIFKNRGNSGDLKGMDDVLKISPPPTIKIAAFPSKDQTNAIVHIKIMNNGGGVEDVKLMHNGKRISINSSKMKLPSAKDAHTVYTDTIPLVGGVNVFTASGFSTARVESDPAEAQVFSDNNEKSSTCHMMVIGIDKYKNSNLALNYAKEDAESFGLMIKEKGAGIYKDIEVHALYDQDASRQNILDTMDYLISKISLHDVFIFFYAGHGSMTDEKFFFIPVGCSRLYDIGTLNKEGIEASVLQEKLKQIKALKQIIIMDACQSGGSVELLAARGALEEKAIAQLSRSAGIHVLASAGSEQNAKELSDLKHGLFTYVLIQALSGDADGAPADGKVTVYELKSYLDDQVPLLNKKYSGKPQYPYTFSRGHDFPVVVK